MPSQRKRIYWVAGRGTDRQTDSDRVKNRQTERNRHDMLCLPPCKKQSRYSGTWNRGRGEETEKEKGTGRDAESNCFVFVVVVVVLFCFFLYVNVHLQSAV